MYTLVSCLALASMLCFVKLLRRGGAGWWWGYLASALLMVYTHNSGWFILAVETAGAIALRVLDGPDVRPRLSRWFLGQLAILAGCLPWAIVLVGQSESRWSAGRGPSLRHVGNALEAYAGSEALLCALLVAAGLAALRLGPAGAAAGGPLRPGLRGLLGRLRLTRERPVWFLAVWLIGPLAALTTAAALLRFRIMDRYTIVGSLALYLLAARGLAALPGRRLRWAAIAIVAALPAFPLARYYTQTDKEQWREATACIEARAERGELVLFCTVRSEWYIRACFDYYSRRDDLVKRALPPMVEAADGRKTMVPDSDLAGRGQAWLLISTFGHFSDRLPALRESGYEVVEREVFRELVVCRLRRKAGA